MFLARLVFVGAILAMIFAVIVPTVVLSADDGQAGVICQREVEVGDTYTPDLYGDCVNDIHQSGIQTCVAPCVVVFPAGTHEDEFEIDYRHATLEVWLP